MSTSLGQKRLFSLHKLTAPGPLLRQSVLISLSTSFIGDLPSAALPPALAEVNVPVSKAVHLPPGYPGQADGSGYFYHSHGNGKEEFRLGILEIIGFGGQSV